MRDAPYVTYDGHMNLNKTFGSFRQVYVATLRTASAATILAVTVLVIVQNYALWMPHMNR